MKDGCTIVFALTGSFCTYSKVLPQMMRLAAQGVQMIPVMSFQAAETDTRFGRAEDWKQKLQEITGSPVRHTLPQVEPLGPCRHQDAFLEEKDVLPNAHINAIGTFTPTSRELTSDLVKNSQVFVDEYAAALKESGDLLIPISEGAFSAEKIVGSLGELVTGKVKLKAEQKGRTIFDAVGLAVEDLCCAEYIYQKIQGEK